MPVTDPINVETRLPEPPDRIGAIDRDTQVRRGASEAARVLQAELKARISGEVRFDRTSRMLYSTDASNYQIEPIGVVIPKSADDAVGVIELAASHGVPILPRGGGSSLAGQTVGAALVIDFSKYCNRVLDLNLEAGTVTVETGSSLDLLNRQLKANGMMFGPDPSSSNRATIGGVIGNNSTGAHSILYGMTADNVVSTRIALATGGVFELGPGTSEELTSLAALPDVRGRLLRSLLDFQERHSDLISRDFPPHWRRSTGYSLNEFVKDDFNPGRLVVSSEGTLATVLSATMKLVPIPKRTALVVLQFGELVPSMEATQYILETEPSAIELMDRMLIGLTRAQPGYASQIAFIEGDPAGVLCVEYYGETDAELQARCDRLIEHLRAKKVSLHADPIVVLDPKQQADVWSVRKAGLGLLYSIRGDFKPIPVIEDVSVPVPHLAEYVGAIEEMVARYGTTAAFYAHASAGCLHIRPLVNLKELAGVEAMKEMAYAAAELAHRFGGVMSGEHGDGLQRSELNEVIFGPELYQAMRQFKGIFDPLGLMNPGKKVDAPSMLDNLRFGPAYKPIEIKTYFDYSREGGFHQAIEQCNGAAVCRKLKAGTMCPSFMATRDEQDTTRARANALRNALA
ncbi:MAG: FAD-binding oxidoreductase, partial [Chloroflexota bacterium]|nr:FAD-binding oxidoreductase [Chloroflexota bacterium]